MVRSAMDFAAMAEYICVWIRSPKSAPKSLREAGVAGAALCAPYRIAISIQPLHEHVAHVRAQAHGGNPAQHFPQTSGCVGETMRCLLSSPPATVTGLSVTVPWVLDCCVSGLRAEPCAMSPCYGAHTV